MKRILLLVLSLLFVLVATLGIMRTGIASIGPANTPEIVYFTATPRVISRGESVTLAWKTSGLASVAMEWKPEYHLRGAMQKLNGLPPSGTMIVQPREDTIYVLECESASGDMCISASASVRVK